MNALKLDITKSGVTITPDMEKAALEANALLYSGKGAGNDFLGWVHLPSSISAADIEAIEAEAAKLRAKADVVICIGIGGSYLGAKAVLEAMSDPFRLLHKAPQGPTVLFAGQNISEDYTYELLDAVRDHSIAAIVISKSGTTTEPAIAFRLIKAEIERRYGKREAAERIVAVTDKARGALKTLATKEGYPTFVIPDDVGGRFSVLTPVGLLPLAVAGVNIAELVRMPVDALIDFFAGLELDEHDAKTAARILVEIRNRLQYLADVGLGYLTLDRLSSTLSGGESQRINLSTSLGSNLTGSLYILDEPSIGLHPRDTNRLIKVLRQLRDLGNTVIVVEHEEEVIRAADYIVDIGPKAGYNGGEVVFSGTYDQLLQCKRSLTADYLTGRRRIEIPASERAWRNSILIRGARENNLRNIDVRIPLGVMCCITGVSGSGKSSLVKGILYPALRRRLFDTGLKPGDFDALEGDVAMLRSVEMIDQNPIGKSTRSNPVTYIKAYDEIRKLFADQPYARHTGLTPAHFSFNVAGGRCEECQGEGVIKVSMQFMADVELVCESCGGKRFKDEVLEVKYRGKSIYDVLEMTVDDAIAFFGEESGDATCRRIVERLQPLQDVGLGYIKLGQSSSTLSGGESQRVKLASFLTKDDAQGGVMFIFDEPTTGLHFHDISKLLAAFDALIERGHTVVIVEHNMDVIKCADWVIDLGPEAGDRGGELVYEGTPRGLESCAASHTGEFLRLRTKL